MNILSWAFVSGMILSMTVAQILFKYSALYLSDQTGVVNSWLLNPWLWWAFFSTIVGMVFWLLALRDLPLSRAYPWTAVIYVLTPLVSMHYFDDHLNLNFFIGMFLIVLGVIITTSNAESNDEFG